MSGVSTPRRRKPKAEGYLKHFQRFSDPQSVYHTAEQDKELAARQLGWLAARLRKTKPNADASWHYSSTGAKVKWPAFKLAPAQRDRLVKRLLTEGVDIPAIVNYTGLTRATVNKLAAEFEIEREVADLIKDGPIDLMHPLPHQREAAERLRVILGTSPPPEGVSCGFCGLPMDDDGEMFYRHREGGTCDPEVRRMMDLDDIEDGTPRPGAERHNRLTFMRMESPDAYGNRQATWRCDCGEEIVSRLSNVRSHNTKSCGCLKAEHYERMREWALRRKSA